jgi:hypothetical protein
VTSTTLDVLGQRIEALAEAVDVSAISFAVAPLTLTPGEEITLTFQLDATVPGTVTVLFLLDGDPLGDPVPVMTGTEMTSARMSPSDLSIGVHRVEMVIEDDPLQVLASRTIGVAATGAGQAPPAPPITPASPTQTASVLPAVGLLALAAAAAVIWHNRRRWILRRSRT